jgi:hypothetical protein
MTDMKRTMNLKNDKLVFNTTTKKATRGNYEKATKTLTYFNDDPNLYIAGDNVKFQFDGNDMEGKIAKIYEHITPYKKIEAGNQLAKIIGPNTPHTTGIYYIGLNDIIDRILTT